MGLSTHEGRRDWILRFYGAVLLILAVVSFIVAVWAAFQPILIWIRIIIAIFLVIVSVALFYIGFALLVLRNELSNKNKKDKIFKVENIPKKRKKKKK